MKARLIYLLHKLRESFWLLPALMMIAAAALSMLTLRLDADPDLALVKWLPWSNDLGIENARLIMSTIAGSMITVTSLVFSMTLVALTLASNQLGPRLLSLFMQDRMTQSVLGAFVSTFVYALLVLASLGGSADTPAVPSVSIGTAMVLSVVCIALLISFIHHLSSSLHADVVIARMSRELNAQIRGLFGKAEREAEGDDGRGEPPDTAGWHVVHAAGGGYLQTVDDGEIAALAERHDTVVRLLCRAGHFVIPGSTLARVRDVPDDEGAFAESLCAALVFGDKRTNAEDPEFAVQAIVEMGLRALSPGVNDPYTALTCVDRLGEALALVLRGELPRHTHRDANGEVRLHAEPLTLEGLFDSALNELRQAAEGNVAVLIRLIETLGRLAEAATRGAERACIRRHADMLARCCERSIVEPHDQDDIDRRLKHLQTALDA